MPHHPTVLHSHAEMQGDMLHSASSLTCAPTAPLFACHREPLHATDLLFARTNEFELTAGKDPVYNPDDC